MDSSTTARSPALRRLPLGLLAVLAACAPGPVEISAISAELHGEVSTMVRVHWTQDRDADAVWLEFDPGDGGWRSSPALPRVAGQQSELVLGVPADTGFSFRVVADRQGVISTSADQSSATGSLPEDLPEPEPGSWLSDQTSPEGWVLGSVDVDGGSSYSGPFWLFIASREGRIVWYRDLEFWMSMFPDTSKTEWNK